MTAAPYANTRHVENPAEAERQPLSLFLAEGEFFRRPTQANGWLEWGAMAAEP
jgi:hypothetical protein